MLPVSRAVYDFRTDLREEDFSVATAVGVTTDNSTLGQPLYDDDIGTVDFLSDETTDVPIATSYNTTSRQLLVSGLSANSTRTLTIFYDVDALAGGDALNTFVGYVPWVWMLIIIVFPVAALAAIFTGRAD